MQLVEELHHWNVFAACFQWLIRTYMTYICIYWQRKYLSAWWKGFLTVRSRFLSKTVVREEKHEYNAAEILSCCTYWGCFLCLSPPAKGCSTFLLTYLSSPWLSTRETESEQERASSVSWKGLRPLLELAGPVDLLLSPRIISAGGLSAVEGDRAIKTPFKFFALPVFRPIGTTR